MLGVGLIRRFRIINAISRVGNALVQYIRTLAITEIAQVTLLSCNPYSKHR